MLVSVESARLSHPLAVSTFFLYCSTSPSEAR